jgi:hypothetical protein
MSAGVSVPINMTLQGNVEQRLKSVTAQSNQLAQSLTGLGDSAKLGELGRQLQEQAEGLHAFRSGVDDTVERLNILGDSGAALAGEINKISDPLKRLELGQLALSGQTSKLGNALNGVNQRFAEMKTRAAIAVGGVENLELVLGAAGVAAGLLAAAVGGTLAAAYTRATHGLEKYIEKNKEAQALQEFAAKAADANAEELGKSVSALSSNFELAQASSTSFFDKYLIGASKILQEQSTYSKEFEALWGVKAPTLLTPALDLLGELGTGAVNAGLHLDKLGIVFDRLATPLKNTFNASQTLTKTFDGQRVAIEQLTLSLSTYGAQLDDVARKAQSATPYLDALQAGEGSRSSQEQGARGLVGAPASGGGARRERPGAGFGRAIAGGVGGFGERGATGAAQALGQREAAGEAGVQAGAGGVLGGAGVGGQRASGQGDTDAARLAQAVTQGKLLTQVLDSSKGAAEGLASAMADVVGGLAAGQIKAKDFGAAIVGAFGAVFQQLGRGFFLQGTALLFTPGGQAAGAGMIGAGLALEALGGLMSRQGGGGGGAGAGAGGGSSVAGAATRVAPPPPDRERAERPVILRVGERDMRGYITDTTADDARRGRGGRAR